MPANFFLDTSVILYMIAEEDPRSQIAEAVLIEGGAISTQVLNEFVNVARRKYLRSWEDIQAIVKNVRELCAPVLPITIRTHEAALQIAQRFGYRIYDSLLLAAATEANCTTLYSEDMQNGQVIGPLTIRNPFAEASA